MSHIHSSHQSTCFNILDNADPDTEVVNPEDVQKWYKTLPCISNENNEEPPEQEQQVFYEDHETRLQYLQQTDFWRWFLNVQAIIVCAVCVFLYGFFA